MDTPPHTVLITGASRGIGAATALACARAGWHVALNYARDAAAAEAVAAQVRALGVRALAVQADVADEAAVMAMFARIDAELPPLRGLVNNAGVVDVAARVDEMSMARVQRMFAVNVLGSFVCAREAVKRMSTRHGGAGGAVVNLSSAAARIGSPGQYVDYAAAKGAIDTFRCRKRLVDICSCNTISHQCKFKIAFGALAQAALARKFGEVVEICCGRRHSASQLG